MEDEGINDELGESESWGTLQLKKFKQKEQEWSQNLHGCRKLVRIYQIIEIHVQYLTYTILRKWMVLQEICEPLLA